MIEDLAEELSHRGLRATRQRAAVLGLLRSTDCHVTALEVFRAVSREHRRVSKKTIYEVLDSLVRAGLALCITDGGEPYRYEAAKGRHYHARCRVCDRLFDVPAKADGPIRGSTPLPEGFLLEEISVTLRGVCQRCRDAV